MDMIKGLFVFGGMVILLAMAGCGGRDNSPPSLTSPGGEAIAESVRETVAAMAAQTAEASGGGNTSAAPAVPATSLPAESPDSTIPSCTVLTGVNLRNGPGVAYEPPVMSTNPGTSLQPIAYVPSGFPLGTWLLVEMDDADQPLWVSAGPQFVSCNIDITTLPRPVTIPPTPVPLPAATPTPTDSSPVAMQPVLRNISGGVTSCPDSPTIQTNKPIVDPRFLLRVDAQLFNPPPGESGNGAGIDRVEFLVNEAGFTHTERVAGYCIFQGGEPDCRDWPRDASGRFTWGEGGQLVVDGDYSITATIYPRPETGATQCHWSTLLTIDVP
ncbi:MAG: hypothetical protein KBD86_01445 [Candidatus Promineofilum sp.]|nr:hypothetical protein [Promineifilum sp.]